VAPTATAPFPDANSDKEARVSRPVVPWQVLTRRTLVERRWLSVHEHRVRLSNGHEIDEFHVIETPAWAGVLAVTENDEVVLVRQYRHGIAGESLELPAGVIEAGEDPLHAAKRELLEETGYAAERWESIAVFAPEPSRHATRAHFFCALGARPVAPNAPDASEEIELVKVSRSELVELVLRGNVVHGVHVGAILFAERKGLLAPK
jgi:8-oxo-dGTP pyrophosphatase MutT (NUDIX family)